jgi:exonuclease VII small subunit
MATAETDVSQLSFEAALARLEEIVRALEKGLLQPFAPSDADDA